MLRIFSSGFSPVRIGSSSVASDSLEAVLLSVLLPEEAVLEDDEDVVVPPLQAARENHSSCEQCAQYFLHVVTPLLNEFYSCNSPLLLDNGFNVSP